MEQIYEIRMEEMTYFIAFQKKEKGKSF